MRVPNRHRAARPTQQPGTAPAPHRRPARPSTWLAAIAAVAIVAGSLLAGSLAGSSQAATQIAAASSTSPTTPIWSTQLDFDSNGAAWSEASFATLKADGLTTAELDMPWGTIEPSAGTFSFTEFDTELANASAAGIQLTPLFWQAGV